MVQALRLCLVAGGDLALFPGFRVAVPGKHAGVAAAAIRQFFEGVFGQLAFQLQAHGVVGVRREAVLHVAAVPDDGVDIAFDAYQGVGEFRDQIRAAFGQGVAECGAAALQAVPSGACGVQVAIGMAQVFGLACRWSYRAHVASAHTRGLWPGSIRPTPPTA